MSNFKTLYFCQKLTYRNKKKKKLKVENSILRFVWNFYAISKNKNVAARRIKIYQNFNFFG